MDISTNVDKHSNLKTKQNKVKDHFCLFTIYTDTRRTCYKTDGLVWLS